MKKIYFSFFFLCLLATQAHAQEVTEAAKNNEAKEVLTLIKNGKNIDAKDIEGYSALAYAILNDNYKLVKKLLKLKATVDPSAIIASAQSSNQKILKLIKKSNFDINGKNQNGDTPLLHALKTNNGELFSFFMDAKADITIPDARGTTPLLYAIEEGLDLVVIKRLTNEKTLNQQNEVGDSPLLTALTNQNEEVLQFLIEQGANINIQSSTGLSPLWFAIEKGNSSLLQQLLQKGANNNSIRNGLTPLLYAQKKVDTDLLVQLLDNGADPTLDGEDGRTPLSIALEANNIQQYNLLFNHIGDHLNKPNRFGFTLLDKAFEAASTAQIKTLINQGAKFGPAQEKNKITPLMYAIEYDKHELIYDLIDKQTINWENFYGKTPLILAIEKGNLSLVQELVRQGADVNKRNYLGNAPIGYAVAHKHTAMVKQLIAYNANVNVANKYGSTPLIEAAYFNLPEIARLLINAGADRNHRANYGDNAFDVATKFNHLAVLNELSR